MDVNKFTSVWDFSQMELGELISSSFDAIKDRLFDYKTKPDPELIKELRMSIQGYLKAMNSGSTPLIHRLRVLDELGKYISTLQQLGVPNLLETYEVTILQVAERAEKKPEFAEVLVELVALAYIIIVSDLQSSLSKYHPASPVAIRRALNMMYLVHKIFRRHQLSSNVWLVQLTQNFLIHELLRKVNTYAMTTHNQKAAILQLRKHLEAGLSVQSHFYLKGELIKCHGLVLITDPQKPHSPPVSSLRCDTVAEQDTIVINMDLLAQKAMLEMREANKKIRPQQQGKHGEYVMTGDALRDAVALGEMMQDVMVTKPRQSPRRRPENKKNVTLETDIELGLTDLYDLKAKQESSCDIASPDHNKVWHVVDFSEGGFYLEKMPIRQRRAATLLSDQEDKQASPPMEVGIITAYSVIAPSESQVAGQAQVTLIESGVAFISWFKVSRDELQSIGVAKIKGGEPARIKIVRDKLSFSSSSNDFPGWIEKVEGEQLKLWSTREKLSPGTPLMIKRNGAVDIPCTVHKMIDRGVNYVLHICNITPPAKEAAAT